MINEVTKSLPRDPCSKKEWTEAVVEETVVRDAGAGFGSLALEKQQYLLSNDLYKCASGDSLSSLQQLADKTASESPPRKKFILEDHSTYTCGGSVRSAWPSACSSSTTTNFLRPRMEFSGYQISGYKKYQIEVALKTVDLPLNRCSSLTPHLTGFLTICGLTNQHPEITTYFEAFAVTHKELGFLSSSWPEDSPMSPYRADDQTDLEHWLNFPAFKQLFLPALGDSPSSRPTLNDVIEGDYEFANYLEQRFIFMRWKEKFLVPDAQIDGIAGASYDGFYYIVHDQVTGNMQGFYYHKDAEKFQQLELIPSYKSLSSCTDCTFEFA
ncbi:hypothetical protein HG536_0B02260 [Torulaspora globosa]|uniref:Vacuolar import and degradation protein 24 n=1 Tax=Torulaspora globosa TaxID=48254 RepID=A0A7G3ZCX7_9SACH|nr:uncharacterized protein HG536_0B02260 [Torulaspora globosa]QLL31363.1 hypothetical protein HG536_0B02260 [Torulaspora globosa]